MFSIYQLGIAGVSLFSVTVFILVWVATRKQNAHQHAIDEFSRVLTHTHDIEDVAGNIFRLLDGYLGTESGYLAVLEAGKQEFVHSFRVNSMQINTVAMQTMLLELLCEQDEMVFETKKLRHPELKKLFEDNGIELMVPLVVYHEISGMLLLGKKKTGRAYTSKDITFLKAVEPVLTITLKNAYLYRKLSKLSNDMHTSISQAEAQVITAKKKIQQMDASKDEFISIASHELRTPITAIKGYIWICLNQAKQPLSEDVKKNLETCYHSAERLLRMVSDMLTVSRMDEEKMSLNLQKVDIASLIQGLVDEMSAVAKQREIEFTLKSDKPSLMLEGDRERLQELFHNVIDNALKFAPHRGIVHIEIHENGDRDISVLIKDNGPGIPSENRDILFTKFGKIQYAYDKTHAVEGAGLGLYISKKIVDLHSGSIAVESEKDKGCTFIITLPFKHAK